MIVAARSISSSLTVSGGAIRRQLACPPVPPRTRLIDRPRRWHSSDLGAVKDAWRRRADQRPHNQRGNRAGVFCAGVHARHLACLRSDAGRGREQHHPAERLRERRDQPLRQRQHRLRQHPRVQVQHVAAGALDRRDHARMVMTDRRADLTRGEIQHAPAIHGVHERSRRPGHHPVDELPSVPNQQTNTIVHRRQATPSSPPHHSGTRAVPIRPYTRTALRSPPGPEPDKAFSPLHSSAPVGPRRRCRGRRQEAPAAPVG